MLKKIVPNLLPVFFFLLVSFSYFSPVLKGNRLSMHDQNMASAAMQESIKFYKEKGEPAWWNNTMFAGMPDFMIFQKYPNSWITKLGDLINNSLPNPVIFLFLLMVGFYILMLALKFNRWISTAASLGFGLGTLSLLFLEAGHVSKILALAYAPGVLAGMIYIFRRQYLKGAAVTALFLGLELFSNHLQITYYLFFVILGYSLYELFILIKEKAFAEIPKIIAAVLVAVLIGIGSNGERIWNNLVYSQETTRGKSELTQTTNGKNGLDKEYAFSWSYGIDETLNLLVPNLMGGSSNGALSTESEVYKTLVNGGVPATSAAQVIQNMPLYHGEQPGTSGPSYSGIVLIFFFVLGMFLLKTKGKWVLLFGVILYIVFAWGKNFGIVNDFMFDHFPGFNKFRDVKMTLIVVHMLIAIGAAFGLREILNANSFESIKKPTIYTVAVLGLLMLVGYLTIGYASTNDETLKNNFAQNLGAEFAQRVVTALQADRASLALNDLFRSLFFMLLAVLVVWLASSKKIKEMIFGVILILLVLTDLALVNKRYFNNDDFLPKYRIAQTFEPTPANQQILADTDPNFRVLNTTISFLNDATDSYWHKNIGGYHGAKLKRTQELYSEKLIKDGRLNMKILNMLNAKYFITSDQNGQPFAQQNPEALGNAWFVQKLIKVKNADEELQMTDSVDVSKEAVLDTRFESFITQTDYPFDTSKVRIKLDKYEPNRMVYTADNDRKGFVVFSEIYYRGNEDWISYVDGKEIPHVRVNYALRGMELPAGRHEIVFEFKPKSVEKGKMVDLAASISLVLLIGISIFKGLKTKE